MANVRHSVFVSEIYSTRYTISNTMDPSEPTRIQKFIKRNMVVIVMVPVIVGLHLGWMLIQNNEKFVKKHEKRDLPIIEVLRLQHFHETLAVNFSIS